MPHDCDAGTGAQAGELDLLAGCPPCQGFSSHRTRNKATSIEDERNDLVFEFIRFVEAMLPKTVMLENVPALAKDWRVHELKSRLHALGYQIDDAFAQVKDAADYGCPSEGNGCSLKRLGLGKFQMRIQSKSGEQLRTQ